MVIGTSQATQRKPAERAILWLSLVKVHEGDYRVMRLLTSGVPTGAETGDQSQVVEEAEERFKSAAADLLDGAESIEGELYLPKKPAENACKACGLRWLDEPKECPRCDAWNAALESSGNKVAAVFRQLWRTGK